MRGHALVAHCRRPMPFSRSLSVNTSPAASLSKRLITKEFLSVAICTIGPVGSITKPSQVFTGFKTVFFQLRGGAEGQEQHEDGR